MKRFISEDPLGYAAGDVNFYRYVLNNPINYTDPLGLDPLGSDGKVNPVLRCHVNPHRDPSENMIGGMLIGAPLLLLTGAELGAGYELVLWKYANAGGIGLNLINKGKRIIGLDWHRFKLKNRMVNRPHLDIPPLKLKHWPWRK